VAEAAPEAVARASWIVQKRRAAFSIEDAALIFSSGVSGCASNFTRCPTFGGCPTFVGQPERLTG
jgi:hypothetical protein